jgi:hypothetical protein
MSNPYRAMIARLAAALQQQVFLDPEIDGNHLPRLAEALLAQPEPAAPPRPECFGFAMSFLGDPEETEVRCYVEALEARAAIQPVPVSERLPGAEDCDEEGRCWIFMPDIGTDPSWRLANPRDIGPYHTHWLPHHALPTP